MAKSFGTSLELKGTLLRCAVIDGFVLLTLGDLELFLLSLVLYLLLSGNAPKRDVLDFRNSLPSLSCNEFGPVNMIMVTSSTQYVEYRLLEYTHTHTHIYIYIYI